MSQIVWILVAAVVVVVTVVLLLGRRKKEPEAAPARKPEQAKPQPLPSVGAPQAEEPLALVDEHKPAAPVPLAVPEKPKPEARPTAPGVKLDEQAEQEAAARLEKERRERKIVRLRKQLEPTRGGLVAKLGTLFKGKKELDPALLTELEETLISSDVGAKTAQMMLDVLRSALEKHELADAAAAWDLLREEVRQILEIDAPPMEVGSDRPYTIMVVGVNGVGKTTTIGKLATQYVEQGRKVVLAAADTFRAAAVNQLEIWGRRVGAEVIKSKEGADPSSVVFDAIKHAQDHGADIVIADTAGRLHTKVPLMEEVKKIKRVMAKAQEKAPHQVLLVLDATTGQNAVQQVAMFKEALEITGLVVTKLDGTAKGGVIIGICHEHKIPIRYIGIGEAKDDLREFDVNDFVEALFFADGENSGGEKSIAS